jgi:hypothetical protein
LGAAARERPGHRLESERLAASSDIAERVALRLGDADLRKRRPALALLHQEHAEVQRHQDDEPQREQPQKSLEAHRVLT